MLELKNGHYGVQIWYGALHVHYTEKKLKKVKIYKYIIPSNKVRSHIFFFFFLRTLSIIFDKLNIFFLKIGIEIALELKHSTF